MNYNFQERAGKVVEITDIKWNARMNHKAPNIADYPKEDSRLNDKTWYPRETVD